MIARYARLAVLVAIAATAVFLLAGARLWGDDEGRLPAAIPGVAAAPNAAPAGSATGTPAAAASATPAAADPMKALAAAVESDPKSVTAWRDLGKALGERRDYRAAAEAFHMAVELSPQDAPTRNNLGSALLYLGLVRMARSQFEQAIAVDPSYPDARFNLGITMSHGQPPNPTGAVDEWRRVVEMAPGTEIARMAQAYIDENSGTKTTPPHGSGSASPTAPAHPGGN